MNKDYSPIAESLTITYKCPECGEETTSDAFGVPMPNYLADTSIDSENSEDYEAVCEHCGASTPAYLYTSYNEGYLDMPDVEEIYDIEEEFPGENDDDYYDTQLFEVIKDEYSHLMDKLNGLSESEQQTIYQLLFVNVIARMEAYLGDTLKKEVLKNEESIRNFIEKYQEYAKVAIKLSDLYRQKDQLHKRLLNDLSSLMYHNLSKVSGIYNSILGVKFGSLGNLIIAVQKRHHIVHRNGKDLDSNPIIISRQDIEALWSEVLSLMKNIDTQLIQTRAAAKHHIKRNSVSLRDLQPCPTVVGCFPLSRTLPKRKSPPLIPNLLILRLNPINTYQQL